MIEKDGSIKQHWFMDYTFVLDERICDGHYYATGLKYLREISKAPGRAGYAAGENRGRHRLITLS